MAGLTGVPETITAGQQFRAIAYLRWRLFANGFRRKGGAGELAARIVVYPIFAIFVILPALGAGFGTWAAVSSSKFDLLPTIFTVIFGLQIVVSINLSAPGMSFDPEALIRFPITLGRYVTVRLFLGLLSASNVIGTAALLAAAVGITVARPILGLIAFPAVLLLATTNMLFIRMVFAWVDRWLSTRRARELFTGFIIAVSIGIQYLNVTLNPGFNRGNSAGQVRKLHTALRFFHSSQAVLTHLHPGLAARSIGNVAGGALPLALLSLAGVALYGAFFLAVFTWRMQREYRGENLSDVVAPPLPGPSLARMPQTHGSHPPSLVIANAPPQNSSVLAASFQKEWTYIRRNTAQFYGMLAPIAMVFLFAGRMGSQFSRSGWTFPAAIAYATLGISALAYNSLGLDASGVQFYFLAPIRFRSIMLAKNLFGFFIVAIQTVIVFFVLSFVSKRPPLLITACTLLWLVFAVLVNVTVGNIRSITTPKKLDPSRLSRKQASQLSALMAIGIMLVVAAFGAGLLMLGSYLALPWLPLPILLVLAVAAFITYLIGLDRLDALALEHRETMIEELSKAS